METKRECGWMYALAQRNHYGKIGEGGTRTLRAASSKVLGNWNACLSVQNFFHIKRSATPAGVRVEGGKKQ